MSILTTQSESVGEEHYPDKNAARIQTAIAALAEMEKQLDDLSSQVSDMKRKLQQFAESESDRAKNEIIEQAKKEAEQRLASVRSAANDEAQKIIEKGESDTESLRARVSSRLPEAVNVIVKAVQSF